MEQRPLLHSRVTGGILGQQPAGLHNRSDGCLVYRLEEKKAVCRTSKFGNAHVFEAVVSRDSARHRLIDDLVALFGGKRLPIVTHLIESGKLSPEELREARAALRKATKQEKQK